MQTPHKVFYSTFVYRTAIQSYDLVTNRTVRLIPVTHIGRIMQIKGIKSVLREGIPAWGTRELEERQNIFTISPNNT